MRIGAIVREIRQEKGLLQSELADMTEMSRFCISRLESADDRNVRVDTLVKVATALEVDISILLGKREVQEPIDNKRCVCHCCYM